MIYKIQWNVIFIHLIFILFFIFIKIRLYVNFIFYLFFFHLHKILFKLISFYSYVVCNFSFS